MKKSNFRDWNLDGIDEAFGTRQVDTLDSLNQILAYRHEHDAFETRYLENLSKKYRNGGEDWNETELISKIIAPLLAFADIDNRVFSYFAEREVHVTIGEYELSGKVDGMIATGFRSPHKPYFCMNEYKRATDPSGDPKGQALIAMLAAQTLNEENFPILGCYIVGRQWCFMALEGKEYAFSEAFLCDNANIFDLHRILKGVRRFIEQLLNIT
ncbi:MAG: hypothetical protein RLZZ292_1139 [Bacteroidota bacterium]|jgi:hypothetical protein